MSIGRLDRRGAHQPRRFVLCVKNLGAISARRWPLARALPIVHRVTMTRLKRYLLVVLLAGTVPAQAHERTSTRIRHAEPINLTAATLPSEAALRGSERPARVRFVAFGRPFELDIESNAAVLRDLPAVQRGELPPHVLYKGRLADIPDSWLRVTNVDGRVYGAISDGADVYAIAPARAISAMLQKPVPAGPDATLIYRAADVESGLGPGFCTVTAPEEPLTGAVQYADLTNELAAPTTAAALLATRELAIGLVADVQFGQRFVDPHGVMLSRLNTVDGIFGAQVGVSIRATELRVLADNGGLKASDANTLLKQLATLRSSTPELRSRGLTHLMTGRDLDGTTAGIAYIDNLCGNGFSASLSEQGLDPWIGALVAAHEIGHNFGALHDGETASPCASTPRTFLMAPSINGSGAFSQCSLSTMAPAVQTAKCLTSTGFVDLALEASAGVSGLAGQPVTAAVELVSVGSMDSPSAAVTLSIDPALQILAAAAAGGTCATAPGTVTCNFGLIAPNDRRRIDLQLRGNVAGQHSISGTLAAPLDQNSSNDSAVISISLTAASDGAIAISPAALSGTERQLQRASVLLSTSGTEPLADVTIRVVVPADTLEVVAASADQGACSENAGTVTCNLGTVAAGVTRRLELDLRGRHSATSTIEATLTAGNDADASNDRASATVSVAAVVSVSSSGRGGGGRTDFALFAVLLALVAARGSPGLLSRRHWCGRQNLTGRVL